MSREHELFAELRDARRRLNIARVHEQDARTALSDRKSDRIKAEGVVEEILSEIETGSSGRPIMDAINGKGKAAGNCDVVIDPMAAAAANPPDFIGRSPEDGAGHVEWTTVDLEEQLEDACEEQLEDACYAEGFKGPNAPWLDCREHGCDDTKILEVLRQIWPPAPRFEKLSKADKIGRTVLGGHTPRFWVGARRTKDQRPTLEGLMLADRVRQVLDLPRAREMATAAAAASPAAKPQPKPGRKRGAP